MADHQITMIALFVLSARRRRGRRAGAADPGDPDAGIARSPEELVAANTVWSTGEGIGAFVGPFVAGVLMAFGFPPSWRWSPASRSW